MFCRKSNNKAVKSIKGKSGVSNFEREPKPVQKLTLEQLKALAK